MTPQGSEEYMPVNLDENTEIESLIQQPAVESQHGRWTRMALALLAAAAGVAALAGYHATGPGHASQSISVMQLTENDECEKLTDSIARCPYVRWHHTISKSNSHVDLTCVPKRAHTKGKTCKEWCEQGTLGYVCLRGQDNQGGAKHNQCVANKNHDNRGKSADNKGHWVMCAFGAKTIKGVRSITNAWPIKTTIIGASQQITRDIGLCVPSGPRQSRGCEA